MNYLNVILNEFDDLKYEVEERKEKIQRQWEESKQMSRKKKKQIRKQLISDYRIIMYAEDFYKKF